MNKDIFRSYVRNEPYDEKALLKDIDDLIDIVIIRYFKDHLTDYDEMRSIGIEKVFSLLNKPYVDEEANLVNYLFTGVRNQVSNYYRKKRAILLSNPSSLIKEKPKSVFIMDFKEKYQEMLEFMSVIGFRKFFLPYDFIFNDEFSFDKSFRGSVIKGLLLKTMNFYD